jgi:hypothetical protein
MTSRILSIILLCGILAIAEEKAEPPPKPEAGFRTFTGRNGKSLEAKVVARIDDETYALRTPEGKSISIKAAGMSDSDQQFLLRWDPEFPVDLSDTPLDEVAEKMGYTAVKMEPSPAGTVVLAKLDGSDIKLFFDPRARNSVIDSAAASGAGLKTRQSQLVFQDGAGKKTQAQECAGAPLDLGGFTPENLTLIVVDLDAIGGSAIKKSADGILGKDLLERLNALVDYKGMQLFVK